MAALPNYYELLGLPTDATPDEIRRAYREAAVKYHPDLNQDANANEKFLQTTKAYEILSNPQARRSYDQELADANTDPIRINIEYSNRAIAIANEPQLLYVLLNITPGKKYQEIPENILNLCLVLDRSTSMQGSRMDTVKDAAVELVRNLSPRDQIAIITFSDRADVMLPSGKKLDSRLIETQIQMIRVGGGTEIFQGLQAGFEEIHRVSSRSTINHIILVTDGRTYGDEAKCIQLAEKCVANNIQITGLGIGTEWNDAFVDKLTGITGGVCFYISRKHNLRQVLKEKLELLKKTFANSVQLAIQPTTGVKLQSAYRVSPEPMVLPGENLLRLGGIQTKSELSILLEFQIDPIPSELSRFQVAALEFSFDLPFNSGQNRVQKTQINRLTTNKINPELPPPHIFHALSQLNLYRMQERARYEASVGKLKDAENRLQRLATELLDRGEVDLAQTAITEAERIQHTQMLSAEGEKQIKYGTRALLTAGSSK